MGGSPPGRIILHARVRYRLGVTVLLIGVQSVVLGLLGTPLDGFLIFADLVGLNPTVIVLNEARPGGTKSPAFEMELSP